MKLSGGGLTELREFQEFAAPFGALLFRRGYASFHQQRQPLCKHTLDFYGSGEAGHGIQSERARRACGASWTGAGTRRAGPTPHPIFEMF